MTSLTLCKRLSVEEMLEQSKGGWDSFLYEISQKTNLDKEIIKIKKVNNNKKIPAFIGNKVLYEFFKEELFSTPRTQKGKNIPSVKSMFEDDKLRKLCITNAKKYERRPKCDHISANDLMESWRRMKGSVGTFKASSVLQYLYKYKPSLYIDPCGGWGGRMLAAAMYGCRYIGYDTNTNLKPCYEKLKKYCKNFTEKRMSLRFKSCLDKFKFKPFDFCLTSPPYCNVEMYNGMDGWKDMDDYYDTFLIPLIKKLKKYALPNAFIAINVSDYIMEGCLKKLDKEYHPKQREYLGQQMGGKKNKEIIYIF